MCARLLVWCVFLCGCSGENSNPIMIASLLPFDKSRLFSSMRVAPAISIAVEKVTNSSGPLPGRQIIVNYADSKCSIADAMNEAINYYVKKEVHVFFGPCCDYAAAPIARQTRYWDIPMVTTGGMARDFALMKHRMFPLLTRVGTNFNSLVNFIVTILKKFNWSRVKLLYEPDGHNHVLERFCHIATDGIHYGLRHQKEVGNLSQEYFKFDYINDILTSLATEVGNNYAGDDIIQSPLDTSLTETAPTDVQPLNFKAIIMDLLHEELAQEHHEELPGVECPELPVISYKGRASRKGRKNLQSSSNHRSLGKDMKRPSHPCTRGDTIMRYPPANSTLE